MKRIYRILKKDITLILKITRVKECSHNKESLMSRNSNIDSKTPFNARYCQKEKAGLLAYTFLPSFPLYNSGPRWVKTL
jgi:hypothetical protein